MISLKQSVGWLFISRDCTEIKSKNRLRIRPRTHQIIKRKWSKSKLERYAYHIAFIFSLRKVVVGDICVGFHFRDIQFNPQSSKFENQALVANENLTKKFKKLKNRKNFQLQKIYMVSKVQKVQNLEIEKNRVTTMYSWIDTIQIHPKAQA